jgi:uncharacterized membrane protein
VYIQISYIIKEETKQKCELISKFFYYLNRGLTTRKLQPNVIITLREAIIKQIVNIHVISLFCKLILFHIFAAKNSM